MCPPRNTEGTIISGYFFLKYSVKMVPHPPKPTTVIIVGKDSLVGSKEPQLIFPVGTRISFNSVCCRANPIKPIIKKTINKIITFLLSTYTFLLKLIIIFFERPKDDKSKGDFKDLL